MTTDDQDVRRKLDELFDLGNLTKWEDSFLVSLADQLDNGRRLTERQQEKLDQIFSDRTK